MLIKLFHLFVVNKVNVIFDSFELGENRHTVHKAFPALFIGFFVVVFKRHVVVEAEVWMPKGYFIRV